MKYFSGKMYPFIKELLCPYDFIYYFIKCYFAIEYSSEKWVAGFQQDITPRIRGQVKEISSLKVKLVCRLNKPNKVPNPKK